jgi:hypothetical protein
VGSDELDELIRPAHGHIDSGLVGSQDRVDHGVIVGTDSNVLDAALGTCTDDGETGASGISRQIDAHERQRATLLVVCQVFFSSSASITMMPLGPRRYVSL